MRLSILIPSLMSREERRKNLLDNLKKQINSTQESVLNEGTTIIYTFTGDEAEIILAVDNKELTTGAKRNLLLEKAKGDYVSFVDCDDEVSVSYFELFKKHSLRLPDCVSPCGWMTTDGNKRIDWELSKDFQDKTIKNTGRAAFYQRKANHLCFIKRELALMAKFPNISNGEDKEFSERINRLLKTESRIFDQVYHYKYSTHSKEY